MRPSEQLCRLLGIRYPIIQAPMAGATTPALAAAVSNAGGLGMLGAAYQTPEQIVESIAETRRLTDLPFGVNLFAGPDRSAEPGDPDAVVAILARYHKALGLSPPRLPEGGGISFEAQLDVVLAERVPVFSFTFGIPGPDHLARLKSDGVVVVGTATTVEEARQLEAAEVDAVVVQGSEAGAHRGTFAAPFESALVGTMALVPQAVDAISLPVIASGGIMDGRGIVAAEALGAAGVQMGTAFLTCHETGIHTAYKAAIRSARADQTAVTRAFSGRPARGIVNEFMREFDDREEFILPFPLQNAMTRPMRNAAGERGDTRLMSLWAGQGASLARDIAAGDLVRELVREAADIKAGLAMDSGQPAGTESQSSAPQSGDSP